MVDAQRIEHEVTLWVVNDTPARMFYAGRRWKVTDVPTRLRKSVWAVPLSHPHGLYGWRFHATDPAGESYVFDVFFRSEDSWHLHRADA